MKLEGINYYWILATLLFFTQCSNAQHRSIKNDKMDASTSNSKLKLDNEEWKKKLDPEVYYIAREKGTEYAFSGSYWNFFDKGLYRCKACNNPLFLSDGKFESSCGWPSFFEPITKESVQYAEDRSHGMNRVEVMCGKCDAHLGHVFDDGPPPTYKRYCINSVILDFEKEGKRDTIQATSTAKVDTAILGGGCFWCVEAQFLLLDGVKSVRSGYAGGSVKNPTYKEVCSGTTGHAEVIEVSYDTSKLSFDDILKAFWQSHDPTQLNRQGNDVGTQYRSVIYYRNEEQKKIASSYKEKLNSEKVYDKPVVTEISPLDVFYPAENYHQNYYSQNKEQGYCQFVIAPKVDKFKKVFKDKLK